MFGLVGTENLGGSQGVGEDLEGFYHMGKNAKSRLVPRYENPQIFIELHFKIKQNKLPKMNLRENQQRRSFKRSNTKV